MEKQNQIWQRQGMRWHFRTFIDLCNALAMWEVVKFSDKSALFSEILKFVTKFRKNPFKIYQTSEFIFILMTIIWQKSAEWNYFWCSSDKTETSSTTRPGTYLLKSYVKSLRIDVNYPIFPTNHLKSLVKEAKFKSRYYTNSCYFGSIKTRY